MPPRSPLPQRHGLDAAWVRTPDTHEGGEPPWATMREFLMDRLPARATVADRLEAGDFVDQRGLSLTGNEPYRPHAFVWFHRALAPEAPAPFPIDLLEVTERFVVVDKPHFLATTPRGAHVTETALVKVRIALDLPELAPAHRLDRLTAGVLVFTTRREYRGAYAGVFQSGDAHKTYEALAPFDPALEFPRTIIGRIEKRRDSLQAELVEGEPNTETLVELVEVRGAYARYRLTPATGKTHQLRVHMASLGLPILGDSLYPTVMDVAPDDFSSPLQLIARRLWFTDPIDQTPRDYASTFELEWPDTPHEQSADAG
ncbi:pseudouridine synthase [Demequina lutea]|uniref:RNA pseudouridylate synthase n=1 Tax=Demequina lutea TaxID=431489 RepID=A0A7Y9ZBD6_9MICO|nr:pseudouridine synthase [Demequina lutea]NYI42277.1 tRNA pseudouridine32 synthase/23S rRNA pseudouridine746 synthase [Demequina lutea]